MSEKGLKMVGRDPNGLAKPINIDGNGSLETSVHSYGINKRQNYRTPIFQPVKNKLTNGSIACLTKKSEIYIVTAGNQLYKNNYWGKGSPILVHTFTNSITQVLEMSDGEIMVTTTNNDVWRSSDNITVWTQVLTLSAGTYVAPVFGVDVYENIVLINEYGPKTAGTNARKAYGSIDSGLTFTQIYEGSALEGFHLHDIKYDPYEGLIWLTTGDNPSMRLVCWTKDFGKTWNEYSTDLPDNEKFTQIIPLPECVLFGSDEFHERVYRYNRRKSTAIDNFSLELAFENLPHFTGDNAPFATKAGIIYGENARAYFGFQQHTTDVSLPTQVWMTTNGYEFSLVYNGKGLTKVDVGFGGTLGVLGPDAFGNFAVRIADGDNYCLRIFDGNTKPQVVFVNELNIRDTTWKFTPMVPNVHNEIRLHVFNTLDKAVTILTTTQRDDEITTSITQYFNGTNFVDSSISIPANSANKDIVVTKNELKALEGGKMPIGLQIRCAEAPTTGSITIIVEILGD